LKWALDKVGAKEPKITSFKDPSIKNCKFLFNLIQSIDEDVIDWNFVKDSEQPEDLKLNA